MESNHKKVLIVDDDIFIQRIVGKMINNNFPEFDIVGTVGSVKESLKIINECRPDLVILDIQLEDGDAFDLLQLVEIWDFKVIFISSNQDYLEKSMQFAAVDFLLKPFDENDFILAIYKTFDEWNCHKYLDRIDVMFSNIDRSPDDWEMVLPDADATITLQIKDIIYGESVKRGSNFVLTSGENYFIQEPLRRYEILLAPYNFFRCHPFYVVNLQQIKKIDREAREIIFFPDMKIPFEAWRGNNLMQKYGGLSSEK